ncbi:TaqI-like C-terminal specificity domain-containing protein [Campylobacter troglodytis]|uniref:TaqI-like C-terminal specificity domain-containing protein n=1 Tax=Campylobacter troglodytis TaxID=654363 RepID=UPI003CFD4BA3
MNKEFIATLDKSSFYTNQKCFIITSERENLAYLTGILNSKLNFWYFRQIGATLGANGYEMSKIFVEKLPIPKINPKNSKIAERIVNLVEQILALKAENSNQKSLASGLETADKSPSLAEGI